MNFFWRRRRADRELDDEVRDHIDLLTRENIARGMSPADARDAAHRSFGIVEPMKQSHRDVRGIPWLDSLRQDIRFAARMLRRSPAVAAVALVSLALGIGANTAVFSIVDAVLLRPLPYKGADRLVAVWFTELKQPGTAIFAPYRDFQEFKAQGKSFEELAALTWARGGEILTWRGSPHQVLALPTSVNFFSLLGVSAGQGRTFAPEDLKNGCTVVLADSFWRNELGSASGIVGGTLTLSGQACIVAGVMPRSFEFYPKQTSLWTLIPENSTFARKPFDTAIGVFGRLKPGVTRDAAERELNELHKRVVQESPAGNWVAEVVPIVRDLQEQFTWLAGRNLRTALLVLTAAVALVLLIACLNVASILLGSFMQREREFAVRTALGSGRSRLLRQLLVESMLLAILGSFAGVWLAFAAVRYFNSAKLVELPPGNSVSINTHVLSFVILLAIVTALFFGLLPAWRVSQVDLNEVLKRSGRTATRTRSHATRRSLVVAQVTLAMLLLTGAGLLIESIVKLGGVSLGFRPDQLLVAQVSLPAVTYAEFSQRATFYRKLRDNLAALLGVEGASLCSSLPPYIGSGYSRLAISGKAPIENREAINIFDVGADYFHVLGVPLLEGRVFDAHDREESQRVAIINQESARRYFAGADPVGQKVKLGKPDDKLPWLTVVGIVADEKRTVVYKEMGYIEPALVYLPVEQEADASMGLVLRVAGNPLAVGPMLQGEVSRLDPNIPVYDISTMNARYSEFLAHPRFRGIMMGVLSALTLLLAAIGIYGVLAQSVAERTQEIGVRMALGARSRDILGLVLTRGATMTFTGIAIGMLAALGLTRFMRSLLFGVSPIDALTFVVVVAILALVAFLASYIPARRASRVDPLVALHYE